MNKFFLLSGFILFSISVSAQKATADFFNLFASLPSSMNNQEILAIPKNTERIGAQHLTVLSNVSFGHTYYPVGKISTGKVVHVLFADYRPGYTSDADDFLITLSMHSYHQKSGEMVTGGSVSYLAMSGWDALYRESSYLINGNEITFTLISTDKKGNKETEQSTYTFGKSLEFVK